MHLGDGVHELFAFSHLLEVVEVLELRDLLRIGNCCFVQSTGDTWVIPEPHILARDLKL